MFTRRIREEEEEGEGEGEAAHHRLLVERALLLLLLLSRLMPLLIWGKCTVGVRDVGPYSPKFRAAVDFRGTLRQGKGEKGRGCCWYLDSPAGVEAEVGIRLAEQEDSELEESSAGSISGCGVGAGVVLWVVIIKVIIKGKFLHTILQNRKRHETSASVAQFVISCRGLRLSKGSGTW